tara:strand:- start:577 stop:810 length:234 start_codon:yes stop_codon:yes gene_type:complete
LVAVVAVVEQRAEQQAITVSAVVGEAVRLASGKSLTLMTSVLRRRSRLGLRVLLGQAARTLMALLVEMVAILPSALY